ncbi:MAG: substrate-binding domain-containing protein, partial [Sphaerochaetaceae bacterium]|nr:substrate-binding domain-containing protein [Sphaerochaetaceae bacterium]
LEKNGLTINNELIKTGFWNFKGGYRAMKEILGNSKIKPTAVFSSDDTMAYGALEAIRNAKFLVPKDISIVGFDDIERTTCSSLQLTTVKLDIQDVAENTWWILKNQISSRKIMNTKTILPVNLIVHNSTAKPR